MILHRFMSQQEFDKLMAGEVLTNTTDHHRDMGRHTSSVGFCFFTENPDEAIHWLSHIVCQDVCVTLQIPDDLLTESEGEYRDVENDDVEGMSLMELFFTPPLTIWRKEYCLQRYSLREVEVLKHTDKYAVPVVNFVPPIEIKTDEKGNVTCSISEEDQRRIAMKYGLRYP